VELLNNSEFSLEQWAQLFILAMVIITISSFVTMVSVWLLSTKLTDIKNLLEQQKQSLVETSTTEEDKRLT
jgi:hypothetical protein